MNQPANPAPAPSGGTPAAPQTIVIQQTEPRRGARVWITRLLLIALVVSLLFNFSLMATYDEYYSDVGTPQERYHSGERNAEDKIAVLRMSGTIMPPFSSRMLKSIERAKKDDDVKGVVLEIDSPGGLVTDSHQIYHRLKQLSAEKPVVVSMKRLAASGGYYIAMGAGPDARIYAEPTTWTGSIGVIIPRYNFSEFVQKHGMKSEPLTTGPYKDSLSPFREMRPDEEKLWRAILDDSYEKFIGIIVENRRKLDEQQVRDLATGQVYTSQQALESNLIDAIGYEEDALDDLKQQLKKELGVEKFRVVKYQHQVTLMEALLASVRAQQPEQSWQAMLDATVPRAMYFFSWAPAIPVNSAAE